jgi:hypothetical protein
VQFISAPEEINSALLSRMVYLRGTVSGYFIICPDEFMSQERRREKCASLPCPRNHEPHAYGIGMTELTKDGCLTLPREIRNAPEFEDPEIVFVERPGFIEVWPIALWNLAMDA